MTPTSDDLASATSAVADKQARFDASHRITMIGMVADFTLSVLKILVGVLGHSAAMIAEGLHSSSDLFSDLVVVVGLRMAKKEADEDHPYGHGKYEAVATLFLSLTLIAVAVVIVIDAVKRLQEPNLPIPDIMALWVAAFSIVTKELLFRYTYHIGVKHHANTIIANAWHHRTDAISSVAVLAGVGGAILGWPIFDPVAAIAVAGFIAKVGGEFTLSALRELTDATSAIDEAVRAQIAQLVDTTPEVQSVHFLKARRLGPDILVDVHVVVQPELSVSEGHQIADKVRNLLFKQVKSVTDVLVHVDTVDDHLGIVVPIFPDRQTWQRRVEKQLGDYPVFSRLHTLMPHYGAMGIVLELTMIPVAGISLEQAAAAGKAMADQLRNKYKELQRIRVSLLVED